MAVWHGLLIKEWKKNYKNYLFLLFPLPIPFSLILVDIFKGIILNRFRSLHLTTHTENFVETCSEISMKIQRFSTYVRNRWKCIKLNCKVVDNFDETSPKIHRQTFIVKSLNFIPFLIGKLSVFSEIIQRKHTENFV